VDVEAITEACHELVRAAEAYCGRTLSGEERARLRQLAMASKASVIERQVLEWRWKLTDRHVRRFQRLEVFIWQ
jgi:hypothetical protein